MATPGEKLAQSLEVLRQFQKENKIAIRSRDLTRTHKERLVQNHFLVEVMKGWYIPSNPEEGDGDSTAWFASYWDFAAAYLDERFGKEWILSPEQSLFLHTGKITVPGQLLVKTPKGGNKPVSLPQNTSLIDIRANLPGKEEQDELHGLRVYTLPASIIWSGEGVFRNNEIEARTALAMIHDASDVLSLLLGGGHSVIAGRLAGAFRNTGRTDIADRIVGDMTKAGYKINEKDPFTQPAPFVITIRESSPYTTRMRLMWQKMRNEVIPLFPDPPKSKMSCSDYIKDVDEAYLSDAYHSLSIEGYRVNEALIEKVRSGIWSPDENDEDSKHKDALAAKGYFDAFEAVKVSVDKVFKNNSPGKIASVDHHVWYTELFSPGIRAGILKASDLAGYRTGAVYIKNSMHSPPSKEAVRDMMPLFFELLDQEKNKAVRVVLGHFIFVYIHPYFDGNGRMGRFLMNLMLASGGYPWTVIPVNQRKLYMESLEAASVREDIRPFASFIGDLVRERIGGVPNPKAK